MNISKNISYIEATKSQTASRLGINNNPNDEQLYNMRLVANMVFQPLREWYCKPIGISSFYRSEALNKAIGGSKMSQHMSLNGSAIDIDADIYSNGITNMEIFNFIKDNLDFDQLIMEGENIDGTPAWIHVSYVNEKKNRKQCLKIVFKEGKAITTKI